MSGSKNLHHYDGIKAVQQYNALEKSSLMPEVSDLGDPVEIEYYDAQYTIAIFSSETDWLICRYTPEEYEIQKTALETQYVFQTYPIETPDAITEPVAKNDGYIFRMLSLEEYSEELCFPQHIIFVGYSDETKEIFYGEFNDIDLDYIESLEDFIQDDCCWKHIR